MVITKKEKIYKNAVTSNIYPNAFI